MLTGMKKIKILGDIGTNFNFVVHFGSYFDNSKINNAHQSLARILDELLKTMICLFILLPNCHKLPSGQSV